jgi:hypothetical protein
VAASCESSNEPPGSIKCGEFFDKILVSFSSRTLLHGVNNNNNNNNTAVETDEIKENIRLTIRDDDYTTYNWSHWNSNKKLKGKPGSYTRKTFDRFTTADSYAWNSTHNTESTAV